jgi:hypothetical protein
MIEESGFGSVSLTNGTGSGRIKNNGSYGSGAATLESRNVKNLCFKLLKSFSIFTLDPDIATQMIRIRIRNLTSATPDSVLRNPDPDPGKSNWNLKVQMEKIPIMF